MEKVEYGRKQPNMRLIIFLTALLAILWSSYWLIMSKNYSNQLNAWINTDKASMTAKVNEIRGFPNRFDTTIADLEIKYSIFGPLRIDRLDVMRLSYDGSHYIFAANKIQNLFDNELTFSKGLASAVSNQGFLPTINFEAEDVSINGDLFFEQLNIKLWPKKALNKLNFSFYARTGSAVSPEPDLSFQGELKLKSPLKFNKSKDFISSLNTIKTVSGKLFNHGKEEIDAFLEHTSNSWQITLKAKSQQDIPKLIRDLDFVTVEIIQ